MAEAILSRISSGGVKSGIIEPSSSHRYNITITDIGFEPSVFVLYFYSRTGTGNTVGLNVLRYDKNSTNNLIAIGLDSGYGTSSDKAITFSADNNWSVTCKLPSATTCLYANFTYKWIAIK